MVFAQASGTAANAWEYVSQYLPHLLWTYLQGNLITVLGVVFALLVVGRLLIEKRAPSNIFAWGLFILFIPLLGVPLYFIFGGRKSRRLVRKKQEIQRMAYRLITGKEPALPDDPGGTPPALPRVTHFQNSFELLGDSTATFKTFLRKIAHAKKHIYIQTYILGKDRVSRTVLARLAEKAREGVQVLLLYDAVGSRRAWKQTRALREAGGRVVRFAPSLLNFKWSVSANLRNHRKIAIFDGTQAIIGGQNLEVAGMGPHHRKEVNVDFSALIGGPVVGTLTRTFVSDWCFAAEQAPESFAEQISYVPPPAGETILEAIASGPDLAGDVLWERILLLIASAQETCTLITPYFIPDEVTFRNIELKAKAGTHVRLIVPEHSDHKLIDVACNSYLHTLEKAGCEILLYRGEQLLHAKLVTVDHRQALIGSVNLDMRSLFVNFEIGLSIESVPEVRRLESWVTQSVLPNCVPYAQTKQSQSGNTRRLLEDAAHLISPLL